VLASPGSHLRQHRDQSDSFLSEAVDCLLPVRGIVRLGDDTLVDHTLESVSWDVAVGGVSEKTVPSLRRPPKFVVPKNTPFAPTSNTPDGFCAVGTAKTI